MAATISFRSTLSRSSHMTLSGACFTASTCIFVSPFLQLRSDLLPPAQTSVCAVCLACFTAGTCTSSLFIHSFHSALGEIRVWKLDDWLHKISHAPVYSIFTASFVFIRNTESQGNYVPRLVKANGESDQGAGILSYKSARRPQWKPSFLHTTGSMPDVVLKVLFLYTHRFVVLTSLISLTGLQAMKFIPACLYTIVHILRNVLHILLMWLSINHPTLS